MLPQTIFPNISAKGYLLTITILRLIIGMSSWVWKYQLLNVGRNRDEVKAVTPASSVKSRLSIFFNRHIYLKLRIHYSAMKKRHNVASA